MNVSKCLDILMAQLGNRSDAATRANCLLEMVLAQQTLLESGPFKPWFTLSETTSTECTASERRVMLPTDFVQEADESALWVIDSEGEKQELLKDDFDVLVDKYGYDEEDDPPVAYALGGDYIHLFPIPSVARTILMKYYKRLAEPTDSTSSENGWFKWAPDLMIAAAGFAVTSKHLQNKERAAIFAGELQKAWDRLRVATIAREEANRMRQMGDD